MRDRSAVLGTKPENYAVSLDNKKELTNGPFMTVTIFCIVVIVVDDQL